MEALAQDEDDLLSLYLAARDAAEAERLLDELVTNRAAPVIRSAVAHGLRARGAGDMRARQDAEDVCGEVVLRLVARLRELRRDAGAVHIESFRGYVAVTAYNCCHDYLRRRHPRRHDLKNKLRYLFTHDPRFALWPGRGGVLVCGPARLRLAHGQEAVVPAVSHAPWAEGDFTARRLGGRDPRRVSLPELVSAIFEEARAPFELDALVEGVAELMGLVEPSEQVRLTAAGESVVRDEQPGQVAASERRAYLARLWAEILALPEGQRAALLLNLKDGAGNSQLELLVLTGVTTLRGIAAALELSPEEFAELWHDLPLDDNTIAERLGLARQQVINLRKSARARLARRMKASSL